MIDPDNGANLVVKMRHLGLVPGSSSLPPVAPTDSCMGSWFGWYSRPQVYFQMYNLARANFQRGWLLQLTPARIENLHQEDQLQFPLTKLALNSACSNVLEMFSNAAVTDLEKQSRGQSSYTLWHHSHAGRILHRILDALASVPGLNKNFSNISLLKDY